MLLVFGGTTEGRRCAQALSGAGLAFLYSTKTEVAFEPPEGARKIFGALETAELIHLCRRERISAIINASHPFAERLHSTIAHAATLLSLPVFRFEREYPPRRPLQGLRLYVDDYAELLAKLETLHPARLLALTGVQTIARLRPWWSKHSSYFQILDRESSFGIAAQSGFPRACLVARPPWEDAQGLAAFIDQLRFDAVVTKESGTSGFQQVKEEAALLAGVSLLILKRPALPANFITVDSEAALLAKLECSAA